MVSQGVRRIVAQENACGGSARNIAQSLAVSPIGTVFVTGSSAKTSTSPWQYATVAYSG